MESKVVKILVMSIFIVLVLIESLSASAGGINTVEAYSGYYDYDYYDYSYDYFYGTTILELLIIIWFFIWFFDLLFSNDSL